MIEIDDIHRIMNGNVSSLVGSKKKNKISKLISVKYRRIIIYVCARPAENVVFCFVLFEIR